MRPPRFFERMLLRAGARTRIGDGPAEDLRREWLGWRTRGPGWVANTRYAWEALRISARLRAAGLASDDVGATGATRYPWHGVVQDLRYGVRGLARAPAFTAIAGITFALGVGATTAIFAVVNGILLEPLPYPSSERLYTVEVNTGGEGWYGSSMPEYFDFEEQAPAFESLAAYSAGDVTMGDTLSPVRVRAVFASASLLPTLGVEPQLGRFFTPSEETSDDNRYVLLSHTLWRDVYGADGGLVGRTIPLFGVQYTVLGIMPPGFAFPDNEVRAWFPFGMNRASPNPRNNHFLRLVGRLAEGATPERAAAQLTAYTARARTEYPEIYSERGFRTRVRSLQESVVGEVRAPLTVAMVAVILVLTIACANVANLFLSRGERRRRELSVRAALGATRGRLVRQLVSESLVLGVLGGAAGVGLSLVAVRAIARFAPASLPRIDAIRVGAEPLALAFTVIALAGLLFGTLPALRFSRGASDGALARGARGVVARRSGRRLRRALVAVQVALACVIAVGGGLMLRTLHNLRAVDPGFDAAHAISFFVSPAFARYAQPEERVVFWDRVRERLAAVPGVEAVGATSALPLTDFYDNLSIRVDGRVTTSIGDAPDARIQRVTPGLFDALGIRLVRGRLFTDADRKDSRPVAVVSQTFADLYWPGEDPIGRTMRVFAEDYPWLEVVGVVADLAHDRLDGARVPMWYVPHAQAENAYGTPLALFAIVRSAGDPAALMPALRAAVRDVDPTAPVSRVRPLDDLLATSLANRTFTFDLLQVFGYVALFLAFIGVYGVATLAVAERQAEIGLRKALGASRRSVVALVARDTLVTVAAGGLAGLMLAVAGTRVMRALLYGVGSTDVVTLLGTILLLALTACAAALVPVRRALQIEPLTSLRQEG